VPASATRTSRPEAGAESGTESEARTRPWTEATCRAEPERHIAAHGVTAQVCAHLAAKLPMRMSVPVWVHMCEAESSGARTVGFAAWLEVVIHGCLVSCGTRPSHVR